MNRESQRTREILEKWGLDGDINDQDLRDAASSFARIQIKNRMMKRIAIGGVFFMAVFIGLMIASVILGIDITKDFKVKNDILVQNNGTVLETSEMFYSVKLDLLTPLSVIKGIQSLKFTSKKDGSSIQFKVVSFYFVEGRNLTLMDIPM